jgi:hypothetical protein
VVGVFFWNNMSIAKSSFPVTMRDRLAEVAYPAKPPGVTLRIDNGDDAGARDYTAAIDRESKIRLHRKLNAASQLEFCLRLRDPALVVPAAGAKIALALADGSILFTGSTVDEPSYDFLGWSDSGPVYRLGMRAVSDDRALDDRAVPMARLFHDVSAGAALRQMAVDVAGAELDCANVAELDKLQGFSVERRRPWSEQAAALASRARAAYRIEDGKLWLEPLGTRTHVVSEHDSDFAPDALKVRSRATRVTDVTVVGDAAPGAYVKEYFVGDAARAAFALSRRPLTRPQRTLLKDDFGTLDSMKWRIADPANALACDAGTLTLSGGTGSPTETMMLAIGRLPLAGSLVLQHGRAIFTGACDGVLGGLYPAQVTHADCLAGFLISTSGGSTAISALIQGAAVGDSFVVVTGHSYLLRTRLYCAEHARVEQVWHSSVHPAGTPLGGAAIAAQVRIVLEIADTDLSRPSQTPTWTTLCEQLLENAHGFADYGLLVSASMHAELSQTRVWRAPEVELTRTPAGEQPHAAMLGSQADGGVAVLAPGAVVEFFDQAVPAFDEQIAVRYRTSRDAVARVATAGGGTRALVCKTTGPHAVSSRDCALAAEALLDDVSQRRCAGEYTMWKAASEANIRPGDMAHLDVPSRALDLDAVIREVWLEPEDIAAARWRVRFRFANEAAEPIAIETAVATRDPEPLAAGEPGAQPATIAALPAAEVYSFGATSIAIDAGQEPPENGGFEVRSEDGNWGSDVGLIARFTTREFAVDRSSRPADYYLRAFDDSVPPRYSDVSTILHVDYPL